MKVLNAKYCFHNSGHSSLEKLQVSPWLYQQLDAILPPKPEAGGGGRGREGPARSRRRRQSQAATCLVLCGDGRSPVSVGGLASLRHLWAERLTVSPTCKEERDAPHTAQREAPLTDTEVHGPTAENALKNREGFSTRRMNHSQTKTVQQKNIALLDRFSNYKES